MGLDTILVVMEIFLISTNNSLFQLTLGLLIKGKFGMAIVGSRSSEWEICIGIFQLQ